MLDQIGATNCEIIAIDNSSAMLERAQQSRTWDSRVTFLQSDVCDVEICDASVILMNYLLQFVEPDRRLPLLKIIRDGLRPGGALIFSEKIAGDDEFDSIHEDFKLANGYSDLEVSQKRSALEKVMVPDTLDGHRERLAAAGFDEVSIWFRCLNWVSLIARVNA